MKNPKLNSINREHELLEFYHEIRLNQNEFTCPPWKTNPYCDTSKLYTTSNMADCAEYFPKIIENYIEGQGYLHRGCPCEVYSHKYLLKRLRQIRKLNHG